MNKVSAKVRKDKKIDVLMSAEQKRIIEKAAYAAGMSCSVWLLSLGLAAAKDSK